MATPAVTSTQKSAIVPRAAPPTCEPISRENVRQGASTLNTTRDSISTLTSRYFAKRKPIVATTKIGTMSLAKIATSSRTSERDRKIYCTGVAVGGIIELPNDVVPWKMVARTSVPKYRVPVPPGVTGSAVAS